MKKQTLSLLICCFSFLHNTYSQSRPVKYGKFLPKELTERFESFAGCTDSATYLYSFKDHSDNFVYSFNLRKFSRVTNDVVFEKEIKIPKTNKQTHWFRDFIVFKNQLLWCSSLYDSEKKSSTAYINVVTADGVFLEKKFITETNLDSKKNWNNYNFSVSADSNKLLVWCNTFRPKENRTVSNCTVLDEKLNVVWQKTFEFPYQNGEFSIQTLKNNDLFFQFKKEPDKNSKIAVTELIHYNAKNDKTDTIKVMLDKKFILETSLQFNNNGNLVYAGYYASEEPGSRMFVGTAATMSIVDGAFYFLIDPYQNKILSSATKNITEEFARQYRAFYYLMGTILLDDGSILLISEYYKAQSKGKDYGVDYIYGDVFIFGFQEENKIPAWAKKINKDQTTELGEIRLSSFVPVHDSKTVYLLYNDNAKNKEIKTVNANFGLGKELLPMLISISGDGTMSRMPLSDTFDGILFPTINLQMNKKEFVFLGEERSPTSTVLNTNWKYRLISITFNEFD